MKRPLSRIFSLGACSLLAISTGGAAMAEGTWTVTAGVSSNPYLGQREILGFGDTAMGSIAYEWHNQRLGFNLEASDESDGDGLRLDRSYLETYLGDFAIGFGARERHWSPSKYSSLILSENARPFPAAYIEKREYSAFDSRFLSWIGPWKGEIFLGQTDSDDNPDGTKLFGMRLQLQPLEGFEIDLVRTAQWGGEGNDESFGSFLDMIAGQSNSETGDDANQLAGLGLSYTLPEDILPIRVYGQAIGEDESGGLPSCFMYLAGVEGHGQSFGVPTTVTLEGATTEIADSTNDFCGSGTAYNNAGYKGGYTNYGTVMGMPMDTDSRMVQMVVTHDLSSFALNYSAGYYIINATDRTDHRLASARTEGSILRVGATRMISDIEVAGEVSYQSFDLDKADIDSGFGVGLRLKKSF
ncbi:capsule assembly Wzi family protein [Falsirhodobacter sp. alg1]|uniref:capsule assembly Wzi family protein n=1 Tax=Falsirhodobacter sp. alg1 TaxID=1472418 RepID=UPI0005EF182D|nr:capsule assembly Wzi family protein [Falsirhodobacter sp. alg1]